MLRAAEKGQVAYTSIVGLDTIEGKTDRLSDAEKSGAEPCSAHEQVKNLLAPLCARACMQTVMSGRINISFVDVPAFSFEFERVRCVSFRPFLARNWCG